MTTSTCMAKSVVTQPTLTSAVGPQLPASFWTAYVAGSNPISTIITILLLIAAFSLLPHVGLHVSHHVLQIQPADGQRTGQQTLVCL